MQYCYIIFFWLIITPVFSQITLDETTFPVAGAENAVAVDSSFLWTIADASATAQSWDFSALENDFSQTDTIFDSSMGIFTDSFPTATLVRRGAQGREEYLQVVDNEVLLLGYVQEFLGSSFPIILETPLLLQQSPMTYGDAFMTDYNSTVAIALSDYPLLDSLLAVLGTFQETFDSLRFVSNTAYSVEGDAFGTCTIPEGTYEVLRLKETTSNESAIEIHVNLGFFGFWVDIGDFFEDLAIPGFDLSTNYIFQNDNEKTPIVKLTENFLSETFYAAFKSGEVTATISENHNWGFSSEIFPNPAVHFIDFKFSKGAARRLNFIDANGRRVAHFSIDSHQSQLTINATDFPRGTLFFQFHDSKAIILKQGKFVLQ